LQKSRSKNYSQRLLVRSKVNLIARNLGRFCEIQQVLQINYTLGKQLVRFSFCPKLTKVRHGSSLCLDNFAERLCSSSFIETKFHRHRRGKQFSLLGEISPRYFARFVLYDTNIFSLSYGPKSIYTKRYVLTGGLHIKAKGKRLSNYYKKDPGSTSANEFY